MAELVPYQQIFWKHRIHWVLIGATVAIPMVTAHLFGLIVGVGLYITGIINIPGMKFFRRIVDLDLSEKAKEETEKRRKGFIERRDRQLGDLGKPQLTEYNELVKTCREIESSFEGVQGGEMFMARIDEIMWTFLRLLSIQQSLDRFLQSETGDNLDSSLKEANSKVSKLDKEIATLKSAPETDATLIDHKEKLLVSFNDRANIIKARKDKLTTANNNLELVMAEKQRLVEQVRFIRAEVISSRNPDALSVKLDSNLQTLGETNRWISQMSEFADLNEQIASDGSSRVGYTGESSNTTQSSSSVKDDFWKQVNAAKVRGMRQ